ncbi:MAG: aminotransferase class I/II-fold pyridoxal phosphate-dependent enzyme [Cyanobacteria bacterium REEB65]|nr:aminotransferase class I/II-fold pyridoxal phosphate-dependent enzyme [Cyanobacteria bacterium REEB65]
MPQDGQDFQLAAYLQHFERGLAALTDWRQELPAFAPSPHSEIPPERMGAVLAELTTRLRDNFPYFHPQYAGQMLKPPHAVASLAYALAMQINPNNHALDGGRATSRMESEAIMALAESIGFVQPLGHLTSSGTIANLEALWVARCLHPGKAVAYSAQSHYTHARMCDVLGIEGIAIAVDAAGRMDLADLEAKLAEHAIGTVIATLGTTGLGALDPVNSLVALAGMHGFRLHVDAAYGGFYRILADLCPAPVTADPFLAMAEADSVVIDPHKHGLQPYGCGAVLFRDPAVGRFYRHDSPYTYFTSPELHLGEISLECSRAGAAAAAFWATLQCFPLEPSGLGRILHATRRAALAFAAKIGQSKTLRLLVEPELDIVTYFPTRQIGRVSAINAATERVFQDLMNDPAEPVYLAKLSLSPSAITARHADLDWDVPELRVLRSCLLKPEHESQVPWLVERIERATLLG